MYSAVVQLYSKTLFTNKKTQIFNRSLVLKFGVLVLFSDQLFIQWDVVESYWGLWYYFK